MIDSPVLEVQQLTVNYERTPVLWDVSFAVPAGQLIGIIGPNGAGKSTLIQAILGLIKPLSGSAAFFGLPLKKVRRRIAYIPQRGSVDWDFPITVLDLVVMGRYATLGLCRHTRASDYHAAMHYLDMVGMSDYAKRQINQLSGGQQQRIFIARALLQEADLYFMDEPFVGIDQTTENILVQILQQLKSNGKTICIVHHDMNTIHSYFDWLIMLNMRLIACGPTKQVFCRSTIERTYGKNAAIFAEAIKRSQDKIQGLD